MDNDGVLGNVLMIANTSVLLINITFFPNSLQNQLKLCLVRLPYTPPECSSSAVSNSRAVGRDPRAQAKKCNQRDRDHSTAFPENMGLKSNKIAKSSKLYVISSTLSLDLRSLHSESR